MKPYRLLPIVTAAALAVSAPAFSTWVTNGMGQWTREVANGAGDLHLVVDKMRRDV